MQKLATAHTLTDASPLPRKQSPLALGLTVLFLAALWFLLCRHLSGEWFVNEQYSFGWFVPFFALYLLWLRWQDRPEISGQRSEVSGQKLVALVIGIIALLLLLPVRLFEIANPEWRLLAWLHAAAVVTLTLLLIWYAGGERWLRHFAFPVAFIFVAVPWPTLVETPVIQGLMRIVAHVAAEAAMLLGIPAQVEGNLIRVSTGLVGVNEACSGIRSLQTSLMIGLLFGELKRLSVLRRVALVVGAVAIALFANFLRAVFLVTVAATKNISEVTRWHDIAGYTIIALVFVGTMGLAYLLGPKKSQMLSQSSACQKSKPGVSPAESRTSQPARLPLQVPSAYLAAALCWLFFAEIGTAAWYRVHETNLVSATRWSVQWPEQAPNFHELKIDPEIRGVLRFDESEAAAWTLTSPSSSENAAARESFRDASKWVAGKHYLLLAVRFSLEAGSKQRASGELAPARCLFACKRLDSGGGRRRAQLSGERFDLSCRFAILNFSAHSKILRRRQRMPFIVYRKIALRDHPRAPQGANSPSMSGSRSEWTRAERVREVLEGRRHLGQQVIEAIFISSEPFSAADAESHLRDLVRDVVVLREPGKQVGAVHRTARGD